MIVSKDNERLKLVRKLHDKRWRDKLGLFFVEGEDAVAAATAPPVDLLWAGEDVEPKLLADVASAPHAPRVIGVYRRGDLPPFGQRPSRLGGAGRDTRALAHRRPGQRRHVDPHRGGVRGGGCALDRLCRPDVAEGVARERRLDLARAARNV